MLNRELYTDLRKEVVEISKRHLKEAQQLHEVQCQGYRDQISLLEDTVEGYKGIITRMEESRDAADELNKLRGNCWGPLSEIKLDKSGQVLYGGRPIGECFDFTFMGEKFNV